MLLVPTSWSENTGLFKRQSLYQLGRAENSYEASAVFRGIAGKSYKITVYGASRKAAKDACREHARSSYKCVPFFGIVMPDIEIFRNFIQVA